MMENTKVNIQTTTGLVHNQVSPNLSRLHNWLESICYMINENDFDTCKDNPLNQNSYWEIYNTYIYEFENC